MPYSLMYEISLVRSCGGVKDISGGSTKGFGGGVDVMSASLAVHRRERVVVDSEGVRGEPRVLENLTPCNRLRENQDCSAVATVIRYCVCARAPVAGVHL